MSKLFLGDSAVILKQFEDESIDLTVTSPPYDNLRDYNGYVFNFEIIAEELFRITKWGGCVVWIVSDAVINGSESGTSFKQALFFKEKGFNIHDTMIWKKDVFTFPDKTRYPQNFEYMFIFSKGKPNKIHKIKDRINKYAGYSIHGTSRNKDGTTFRKSNDKKGSVYEIGERFNVWEISCEKNNRTGHPAVFPIKLAKDHILSWSNSGDTILDPFMGSGTTGVAAYNTGRQFVGVEISEKYFNIAKQRIEDAEAQLKFSL